MRSPGRPRGVPLVLSLQALVVTLVVAWFATGHASAPDDGLQQLDVLAVHERVPGLAPVGGTLLLGGWGWGWRRTGGGGSPRPYPSPRWCCC